MLYRAIFYVSISRSSPGKEEGYEFPAHNNKEARQRVSPTGDVYQDVLHNSPNRNAVSPSDTCVILRSLFRLTLLEEHF